MIGEVVGRNLQGSGVEGNDGFVDCQSPINDESVARRRSLILRNCGICRGIIID